MNILNKIEIGIAAIGGMLSAVYGSTVGIIYALLIMMCIDYTSGVIKGVYNKELASNVGARGLFKKGCILLVLAMATVLDEAALNGTGMLASATAIFYICNEAISITENVAEIGVPIPQKIIDVLAQLRKEED